MEHISNIKMNKFKKILIIALSGAGDVLMATPIIRWLKKAFPKSQIDCIVMMGKASKKLLENNPDVSNVTHFDFMKEGIFRSLLFCSKLRKEKYDLSITTYPQGRYHYSAVSFLIGAKKRIGFHYETHPINLNKLFFHKTINEDFKKHVVEHNLEVLKHLEISIEKNPKTSYNLTKNSKSFANNFFKKNNIKKAIVIHPGSGTLKNFILKRWLKERFAQLSYILAKKGYQILLVGGKEENELKESIISLSKLKKNKDIFNINEEFNNSSAIISKAKAVISNDSIIGHLSAALNVPVISLFGPTSPENTSPYTKNKIVLCKRPTHIPPWKHGQKHITPEQAHSMSLISVNDVLNALNKFVKL